MAFDIYGIYKVLYLSHFYLIQYRISILIGGFHTKIYLILIVK